MLWNEVGGGGEVVRAGGARGAMIPPPLFLTDQLTLSHHILLLISPPRINRSSYGPVSLVEAARAASNFIQQPQSNGQRGRESYLI